MGFYCMQEKITVLFTGKCYNLAYTYKKNKLKEADELHRLHEKTIQINEFI